MTLACSSGNLRGSLRVLAVLFLIVLTLHAVVTQAASTLRAHTDALADFDLTLVILADSRSFANNLVANLQA